VKLRQVRKTRRRSGGGFGASYRGSRMSRLGGKPLRSNQAERERSAYGRL
jgi:hypothetical protein